LEKKTYPWKMLLLISEGSGADTRRAFSFAGRSTQT
jgi:hypothetical protein